MYCDTLLFTLVINCCVICSKFGGEDTQDTSLHGLVQSVSAVILVKPPEKLNFQVIIYTELHVQ